MDKSANPVSIFWNRKLTQLSTSRLCLSVLAIALVSLLVATLISHRHWRSSDEGDQLTGVEYTLLFTGAVYCDTIPVSSLDTLAAKFANVGLYERGFPLDMLLNATTTDRAGVYEVRTTVRAELPPRRNHRYPYSCPKREYPQHGKDAHPFMFPELERRLYLYIAYNCPLDIDEAFRDAVNPPAGRIRRRISEKVWEFLWCKEGENSYSTLQYIQLHS